MNWRPATHGLLGRSGFRPQTTRVLLCARDRDPEAALDRLRREVLQDQDAEGRQDGRAGPRLHEPDLVYAIRKENIEYRLTNNEFRSVKDKYQTTD